MPWLDLAVQLSLMDSPFIRPSVPRACEQQVNQIKQLEKDMKMGKRELKLLAEKVSLRSSAEATI